MKKIFTGILDLLLLALAILIAASALRFAWLRYYRAAYPLGYGGFVLEQSEATGVSPALLFAVIRTESGFDPTAESSVPARGLMQITSDTFDWLQFRTGYERDVDYDDLFDPEVNIGYGAELLRLLLLEFGSENNALCAYHAGWGRAKKWLDDPAYSKNGEIVVIPYGDTRAHVEKALRAREIYQKLYQFE